MGDRECARNQLKIANLRLRRRFGQQGGARGLAKASHSGLLSCNQAAVAAAIGWLVLFSPLLSPAAHYYRFEGIVSSQGFRKGTGASFSQSEAPFSLVLAPADSRWFLRTDRRTDVWTETSFDGTNLYYLVRSPGEDLRTGRSQDLDNATIVLLPSRTGVPESAGSGERFLWLGLASGSYWGGSEQGRQERMTVPWAATKGIMPEIDCFDYRADCFPDELHSPRTVKFLFSEDRWKREYPREGYSPFTNNTLVGLYQVLATTNYDNLTVPVEFSLKTVGDLQGKWASTEWQARVTNIATLASANFQVDPSSYHGGVTVHDNRFHTQKESDLIVSYNITNQLYPATNASWLQEVVQKKKQALVKERKLAARRRLMELPLRIVRSSILMAGATAVVLPGLILLAVLVLWLSRRKPKGKSHDPEVR